MPNLILISSNIASTHGLMSPQYIKRNNHFTHPKPWLSKPKSTNYGLQGSYTPSLTRRGSPTPSLLTKNRALFTFALNFTISTMLVPKTTSPHLSSTKLSMIVQATRPYPSWMCSLATIKSNPPNRSV
jgi:hypothetical protein